MNTKAQRIFPIRFSRLHVGSKYNIFAEPSRNIRKSTDKTVYLKVCEAYSLDIDNNKHVAILYPEDLVIPLTRGG